MQRKKLIPWAAAVLGVLGGVLRALDLTRGYDAETGLPTGAPFEAGLLAVLAAAVILLFVLSRAYRAASDTQTAFEAYFAPISPLSKTVSVLCAACFALAGAGGTVLAFLGMRAPAASTPAEITGVVNPVLERALTIPLWLLAMLTAVMLFQAASACARGFITVEQSGLFLIPVFWSLYDLLLTFKDNSSNPIVGPYLMDILAAALISAAFYFYAVFLFKVPRPAAFAWVGSLAAVCGLASGVGELAAGLLGASVSLTPLLRQVCYLASAVWLLTQLAQMPASSEPVYVKPNADAGNKDEETGGAASDSV